MTPNTITLKPKVKGSASGKALVFAGLAIIFGSFVVLNDPTSSSIGAMLGTIVIGVGMSIPKLLNPGL